MTRTLENNDAANDEKDKQLWAAVLSLAIEDAQSVGTSRQAQANRADAVRWFCEGGKDFQLVCTLAGVDPEAVRDRVMQMPGVVEKFRNRLPDRTSPELLPRSNMGFFAK